MTSYSTNLTLPYAATYDANFEVIKEKALKNHTGETLEKIGFNEENYIELIETAHKKLQALSENRFCEGTTFTFAKQSSPLEEYLVTPSYKYKEKINIICLSGGTPLPIGIGGSKTLFVQQKITHPDKEVILSEQKPEKLNFHEMEDEFAMYQRLANLKKKRRKNINFKAFVKAFPSLPRVVRDSEGRVIKILTNRCDYDGLSIHMDNHDPSPTNLVQAALDISRSIVGLVHFGITTLDLKPENILLGKWARIVDMASFVHKDKDEHLLPSSFFIFDYSSEFMSPSDKKRLKILVNTFEERCKKKENTTLFKLIAIRELIDSGKPYRKEELTFIQELKEKGSEEEKTVYKRFCSRFWELRVSHSCFATAATISTIITGYLPYQLEKYNDNGNERPLLYGNHLKKNSSFVEICKKLYGKENSNKFIDLLKQALNPKSEERITTKEFVREWTFIAKSFIKYRKSLNSPVKPFKNLTVEEFLANFSLDD